MFRYLCFCCVLSLVGCSSDPIEGLLNSHNPAIKKVMDNSDLYEVQIIYTQVERTPSGHTFTEYRFQSDPQYYFYPASTVKFPVAILAAEYVSAHPKLNIDTPYSLEKDSVTHTIADDINKIFTVSDNEAYNRLYELLGRDYVNNRLEELGLKHTRIAHRLATANAAASTRKKIAFYPSYEGPVFKPSIPYDQDLAPLKVTNLKKGVGFIKEGNLVNSAMDFSLKNAFPLEDQHYLMKNFFFPENGEKKQHFMLNSLEEKRIKNMMAALPRDSGYDTQTYYDSYGKFFMYGDSKETIPNHIKIYNKVGYAYGTLTETAYIVDEKENIQFLLSATLLVNKNRIFNDDTYEYDSIGIPFLAQLGKTFYQYSLKNKK